MHRPRQFILAKLYIYNLHSALALCLLNETLHKWSWVILLVCLVLEYKPRDSYILLDNNLKCTLSSPNRHSRKTSCLSDTFSCEHFFFVVLLKYVDSVHKLLCRVGTVSCLRMRSSSQALCRPQVEAMTGNKLLGHSHSQQNSFLRHSLWLLTEVSCLHNSC